MSVLTELSHLSECDDLYNHDSLRAFVLKFMYKNNKKVHCLSSYSYVNFHIELKVTISLTIDVFIDKFQMYILIITLTYF